jgi:hypothetical protein
MNINDFVKHLSTDMEAFEDRELVIWHEPLRNASIRWAINCLSNPKCQGSDEAIAAILYKRATNKMFVATNGDSSKTYFIIAPTKEAAYEILKLDKENYYGDDKSEWDYPYELSDFDEIDMNQEPQILMTIEE